LGQRNAVAGEAILFLRAEHQRTPGKCRCNGAGNFRVGKSLRVKHTGPASQHRHHDIGVILIGNEVETECQIELKSIMHGRRASLIDTVGHATEADHPGSVQDQHASQFRNAIVLSEIDDRVTLLLEKPGYILTLGFLLAARVEHFSNDQAPGDRAKCVVGENGIRCCVITRKNMHLDSAFADQLCEFLKLSCGPLGVGGVGKIHVMVIAGGFPADEKTIGLDHKNALWIGG